MRAAVFGGGNFVAVGDGVVVLTSAVGAAWTRRDVGTHLPLLAITSTGGVTWNQHPPATSTHLIDWTPLGPATETNPGPFEFTDALAPAYPTRFYQLRSPCAEDDRSLRVNSSAVHAAPLRFQPMHPGPAAADRRSVKPE